MVQQLADRREDMASSFDEDAGHLVESLRRLDLVDRKLNRRFVGGVQDVVDSTRKREQVLAVEGRRVCVRKLIDQDPSLRVTLALDLFDLLDEIVVSGRLAAELLKRLERPDGELSLFGQQRNEASIV